MRLLCLFFLSTALGCGKRELDGNASRVVTRGAVIESADTLYYVDLTNPTVEQAVDLDTAEPAAYKFVQVEVAEVKNPQKHPLTFEVGYRPEGKPKIFLGSFSLYPSDNPGRFIVPTQGKLSARGVILVSLTTPDTTDQRDTIRAALKKIRVLKR